MNRKLYLIVAMLAIAGLSGCATMSADECLTSDWRAIGFEDGARGYTADRIGKHRKACAKHGVSPDFTAYSAGRDKGLGEYCQPSRGFSVGSNGGNYNGVCSAHYESDFLDAFNAGRHLYTLRSNVYGAEEAITSREYEIEDLEREIDSKEVALISDETTASDRVVLLVELKNLSEQIGQLEAEIRVLQEDRARFEVELEDYELVVADLGY